MDINFDSTRLRSVVHLFWETLASLDICVEVKDVVLLAYGFNDGEVLLIVGEIHDNWMVK